MFKNTKFGTPDEVSYHLCMRGFMAEYYNWTLHGKDIVQDYFKAPSIPQVLEEPTSTGHVEGNYPQWGDKQYMNWAQRIFYAAGPSYFASFHKGIPDDGMRFCSVDVDTSSYVYDGGGPYDYDKSGIFPSGHTLLGDYFNTKKLVKDLGLPVENIHACKNDCMLYWKDDVDLEHCKFCEDGRYKLARGETYYGRSPRMQSLEELRNVRLGFCTDGFVPHGQYGCAYFVGRLSLHSTIFPLLWHVGVRTYDHATDWAFMMRTALMWIVNDLPIYGMASGWSTMGLQDVRFNRVENKVARLRLTRDQILDQVANISPTVKMPLLLPDGYCSDHEWTKKNIFWDLPYWSTLLIRHNLDVMHIENNVFDTIFNTVVDIKDLKIICNRPELELDERRPNVIPKAVYTQGKEQKRRVCVWICGLMFPDGYAFNLACCVDMTELRMHSMKRHDCHVFMQKLISIAFRKFWKVDPFRGMKVHSSYHLVDVNFKKLYQKDDPFIIAQQEVDVYFIEYPSGGSCTSSYSGRRQSIVRVVLEAVGTSRELHENDNENEDEDKDNGGDDETDDEEYEATLCASSPPGRGHRGQGCDCGRDCGPPNPPPAKPVDPALATPSSEAVSQPPSIPVDSGAIGSNASGAISSQGPGRSWDAPSPPTPQRHSFPHRPRVITSTSRMSDRDFLTLPSICCQMALSSSLGQHIGDPKGPPAILISKFEVLQVSCWWDCDDESMFKLVKSQGEENSNEEQATLSQASVTPYEQQLWMSVVYSVSAPTLTTRLLDYHSLVAPLLLRPRRHSRRVTTCVIGSK
ncbi:hypothetical protein Sango_3061700 [Sesamum angolense]|uniref:DUF4216 domain-containing protein n=1 Tax=Sesamum angolense TaxID=2727404 RepID=A0AAE1W1A9_9LAMI|nr:hypothetical protein Sango_3061700 [Sesamum angolense]